MKIGSRIHFKAIDDFTGKDLKLCGVVIARAKDWVKKYPNPEYAETGEDDYIVEVGNNVKNLHLVNIAEVLQVVKSK